MNLQAFVLPIGVINIPTGKTCYDWSIYDGPKESVLYLCQGGFLLYGRNDSFNVGDTVILRNNDSQRKLKDTTILAILPNCKINLTKELLEHGYDYRTLKAFSKKKYSNKLMTSYSIKGVTNI